MSTLRQTLEGLLTELLATPDEPGARLVLADLLTERGDPLGELISLSASDLWSPRLLELLAEHEARLCALVAPKARRAWVHRGLPEVAWYDAGELLAVDAARFPLLRSLVVEYRRGAGQVLQHPLLRGVHHLTLVGTAGAPPLGAVAAPLRSLTLKALSGLGAATLLRSVPELRRLRIVGPSGGATRFIEALEEVRPALHEFELTDVELGPLWPRLQRVCAACGVQVVRLGGTAPAGAQAWFPEPGLELSGELAHDHALELFSAGPAHLLASSRPATLLGPGDVDAPDREALIDLLVADMRARACRTGPSFAKVVPRFLEGAPAALEAFVDGVELEAQRSWPLSRQLLRLFAQLALQAPQLRPDELDPARVVVGEHFALRPPWQGSPRGRPAMLGNQPDHYSRMSPEFVRGLSAIDPAPSALFSLGVMLFTALTGELPQADAHSTLAVLQSTIEGRLRRLSKVAVVPPALDALVAKQLATDPRARPTPAQVAAGLEALAAMLPSSPWPTGPVAPREVTLWPALRPRMNVT
jgi:uncharacterized protein (TIGR02996 family)